MYDSAIQTILRPVVIAKLTYAASAWTGEQGLIFRAYRHGRA